MLRRLRDRYRDRQRALHEFFSNLPAASRWRLALAVFFCFAPIGLLSTLPSLRHVPWTELAILTGYSGGIAVLYGASATSRRRRILLPVAVLVNIGCTLLLRRMLGGASSPVSLDAAMVADLRAHLTAVTTATIGSVVFAYTFFVQVIQRESRRFVQVQAEIRLASEIHAALVPAIAGRNQEIAYRGVSQPSGAVGGDLVDVLDDGLGWMACVADVSGHGVPAGLLMAMFKTALHGARPSTPDLGALVSSINRTLGPLKQSNMFVTAAVLKRHSATEFDFILAGHPPLLHISDGGRRLQWVGESQLAVGLLPEVTYRADRLTVSRDDVLVLITDGLLEVFDRRDRELGADGLTRAIAGVPFDSPLDVFERAIFETARRHGPQLDDQTLLVVRT